MLKKSFSDLVFAKFLKVQSLVMQKHSGDRIHHLLSLVETLFGIGHLLVINKPERKSQIEIKILNAGFLDLHVEFQGLGALVIFLITKRQFDRKKRIRILLVGHEEILSFEEVGCTGTLNFSDPSDAAGEAVVPKSAVLVGPNGVLRVHHRLVLVVVHVQLIPRETFEPFERRFFHHVCYTQMRQARLDRLCFRFFSHTFKRVKNC